MCQAYDEKKEKEIVAMQEIGLPNQESMRYITRRKEKDKHLGILEVDTIKEIEMKEKSKKYRWTKKNSSRKQTMPPKSHQRNKCLGSFIIR